MPMMTFQRMALYRQKGKLQCLCCHENVVFGERYIVVSPSVGIQHVDPCPRRKAKKTRRNDAAFTFTETMNKARAIFTAWSEGALSTFERTEQLATLKPVIDAMRMGDRQYVKGYIDARTYEQDKPCR
jgi:hypothetical protein